MNLQVQRLNHVTTVTANKALNSLPQRECLMTMEAHLRGKQGELGEIAADVVNLMYFRQSQDDRILALENIHAAVQDYLAAEYDRKDLPGWVGEPAE